MRCLENAFSILFGGGVKATIVDNVQAVVDEDDRFAPEPNLKAEWVLLVLLHRVPPYKAISSEIQKEQRTGSAVQYNSRITCFPVGHCDIEPPPRVRSRCFSANERTPADSFSSALKISRCKENTYYPRMQRHNST